MNRNQSAALRNFPYRLYFELEKEPLVLYPYLPDTLPWGCFKELCTLKMFVFTDLLYFTFSILGMNLFGCKFCDDTKPDGNGNKKNSRSAAAAMRKFENMTCDRKNFDSLLWATVTVFQVSIQSPLELLGSTGASRALWGYRENLRSRVVTEKTLILYCGPLWWSSRLVFKALWDFRGPLELLGSTGASSGEMKAQEILSLLVRYLGCLCRALFF